MKNVVIDIGAKYLMRLKLCSVSLTLLFLFLGAANAFATLSITTEAFPFGEVIAYRYYYAIPEATGGTTPYTWSIVDGNIPDGLAFNPSNGWIWQAPTTVGDYTFTLKVQDAAGLSAEKSFTISIYEPLSIPNLTTDYNVLAVGSNYHLQMAPVGGLPPYTLSITSGTLPEGLVFDAATNSLAGTLTAKGYNEIWFALTDAKGSVFSPRIIFNVCDPLVITTPYSTALPNGLTGTEYGYNSNNFLGIVGGSGSSNWSISQGRLPAGVIISPWLTGGPANMASINGIPLESGAFDFTVRVTDGYLAAERNFTIYINYTSPIFAYDTNILKSLITDQSYSIPSKKSGGIPPYSFSIAGGSLPNGMVLNAATGALTGTPTTSESTSFTAQLEDNEVTPYLSTYPTLVYAGNAEEIWNRIYGSCGYDGYVKDLAIDGSGNLYVTGLTTTKKYNPQGTILNTWDQIKGEYITLDNQGNIFVLNSSSGDFVTTKYSPSGNIIWSKIYSSTYKDVAKSIALDSNGNTYVHGYRYDTSDYYNNDIVTIKYDQSGNTIWQKIRNIPGREESKDMNVDKNGNSYLVLWDGSYNKSYILKYDTFGNELWTKTDNSYSSHYYSVATDQSQNVYVTGNDGITKFDQSGNLIWKKDFKFGSSLGYSKTTVDSRGIIYCSYGAVLSSSYMNNSIVTVAFDSAGNRLGIRSYYDGNNLNNSGRIAVDGKGHMYTLASSRGTRNEYVFKYRLKPFIVTPILPSGTAGMAYNQPVNTTSGLAPYSWALVSGTLPPGLALNSTTGALTGVPTVMGTFDFSLRVTDANGANTITPLQLLITDTVCTDFDKDGYNVNGGSCGPIDGNDNNFSINPGATEIPYNRIDENGNGMGDDDDIDQDGYSKESECNDSQPGINPGANEIPYNRIDENCNGMADDDDLDHDGYNILAGYYSIATDCNDSDAASHPEAIEIPYNGIDENCNGMADDDDLDHDGYGIATDCKDNDPAIHPGLNEIPYNGIDENCNGMTDDDDLDHDGYGNVNDCNDSVSAISPGVNEIPYNDVDENCSGMADDTDYDGDGYKYTVDCNDDNSIINPRATETPYNGIDENCNGMGDDDDLDHDGYKLIPDIYGNATDCNDLAAGIHPSALEIKHDGIDQDCNGYDLTIDIISADYDSVNSLLTVKATSALGTSANLEVIGYGPMIYKAKQNIWMFNYTGQAPDNVTVSGQEGAETLAVTVQ